MNLYRIGCGTSSLTTSLTVERKRIAESCSGNRLTLKERTVSKRLSVSLSMAQFSARTLAAAFYGNAALKAAGTVTSEVLPQLNLGGYFTLHHPDVTNVVIQDSTEGAPLVYVLDTHYEIQDAKSAQCRLLKHPEGYVEPVKVDYSYGEYINIAAFAGASIERGLIFFGVNGDGQRARIVIPRLSLEMKGDFSWLGDDEASLELSGEALFVSEMQSDADYGGFMRISLI